MIDYRRCLGASVMLVATLQAVAAIQPPLIAARSIASSGVAATNTTTGGTTPQLTVFGIPQQTGSNATAIQAGRLDGSLTDVAQRYPSISSAHPIRDLHAINPAAHFRISTPLTTPEVLIDAVATGDPQALKTSLQNLGLRDVAVFANDVGGWLAVDQLANASALPGLHFARAAMPRTRSNVPADSPELSMASRRGDRCGW